MVGRVLTGALQACGAAFQLLTRVPVPAQIPFTPAVLARSAVFFPLTGLLLGLLLVFTGELVSLMLPAMPAAALLLIVWTAYSGALHLDGWMDTADGVLSHRSRERMLEIMKDSRVGAMGVAAAVLLLLLKFALLESLLESGRWQAAAPFVAAACGWSRLWMVFAIACWPFARPDEGMASMFAQVKLRHAAMALLLQAALQAAVCAAFGWPWTAALTAGGIQLTATALCGTAFSAWLNRKLGGLTGDTYGAANELLETALLMAAVLLGQGAAGHLF